MLKYSLVMPIYGIEKYLSKSIESVLNQTYNNFELILVDDGSLDECPQICDYYSKKDNRVKVIHKENGGLVSARKIGAQIATGEYIICIDGDDWLETTYLEEFDKISNKYFPDIICCGYVMAFEDKKDNKECLLKEPKGYYNLTAIKKIVYPQLIEEKNGNYFSCSVWAKAYKRELYKKSQLLVNEKIKIAEDHACTKVCIHNANSMYIIDECLYYYRQNMMSMTKKKNPFDWNGPKYIGKHFENNIPMDEYDFQDQVNRIVVHLLFNTCITQFNRSSTYRVVKKDIIKNISKPYYQKAIKGCKYSLKNIKGNMAKLCLKYKLIGLMKIYNSLHTF